MKPTISQGFPDFKNYLGQGRNYFKPTPQLLRNYYFTGAFTGGWFCDELFVLGSTVTVSPLPPTQPVPPSVTVTV
jgi:hypothetical protein